MQTLRTTLLILFCTIVGVGYANKLDSLSQALENPRLDPHEKLKVRLQLAKEYLLKEKNPEAEKHYLIAIPVAKALGSVPELADAYHNLAKSYQNRTAYSEALMYHKKLLDIDHTLVEPTLRAGSLSQISSIYQELGDYEKAFEVQLRALQMHEMSNDSVGIARGYYVIGTIFFYQKQYQKSLEYYEKAKIICDVTKNNHNIYSCLAALGTTHSELGNYQQSLEYNDKALKLARKLDFKGGIAYVFGNMGSNYRKQKQFEKAEYYKKQAIERLTELDDKWGSMGNHLGLAEVYLEWGKEELALPILDKAMAMAQEFDSKPRQLEAYENYARLYRQLNDIEKAFAYQDKYLALKDTILSEKTLEEMGQSQRRYELQQKEHEISLLKKENELLAQNEKIQSLRMYIFGIGFLLFLIISAWFISRLKYQRSINKLLEEKNSLLNSKNEEIHIKNKQLEHSNEDLQRFAYVASHDLKEPLRMIHSYTTLLERRYKGTFDESGKEFMFYITDAVLRMQTLLDDLLDYSRTGNREIPRKWLNVSDVLTIVKANLRLRLADSNGKLLIREQNMPTIKANSTQLIQLFQNLVSNAVKFKGHRDPVIVIDCSVKENQFVFSVEDNGIGISKQNQKKVFEMFRRLHTREEYEGTGIGLATCKRIVSNLGGDIWVESIPGEGSTFFFSIPCPNERVPEEAMAGHKQDTQSHQESL
ncbi:MAG: tetratricopeptide repeat protein [Bacteroidota bacterium]